MARTNASIKYGSLAALLILALIPSETWAKRTITGTVTLENLDNSPAVQVTVAAYDEDDVFGGDSDFMAMEWTNSKGEYRIEYPGGPWDFRVAGSNSFRPDIFLVVYVVEGEGPLENMRLGAAAGRPYDVGGKRLDPDRVRVFAVKKTVTKQDWRMSEDLHWDIKVPGIRGTVKYASGAPAEGLLVRALDDDINANDPLSATTTSSDGKYFMFIPGGHCDWTPDNPIGLLASAGVSLATGGTAVPLMSEVTKAITDSAWANLMHRHWTSWRCDVYVRVLKPDGKRLDSSGVHENHRHRETITEDFVVPNPDSNQSWQVLILN